MRRFILALAAVATSAGAGPLKPAQLDCVVLKAPPGLADKLAAGIVAENYRALQPLRQQLGGVIGQCVRLHRMTDAQGEAYEDYAMARLPHGSLQRQLAKAGLPMPRIDAALARSGDGPGQLLEDAGFTEAKLGSATWARLLAYGDLAQRLAKYRAALLQA